MTSEFVRELKRGIAAAQQALEHAGEDEAEGHRERLAELREIAQQNDIDLGESGR